MLRRIVRLEVYYKWDEDPVCAVPDNVPCIDYGCCFELDFSRNRHDYNSEKILSTSEIIRYERDQIGKREESFY